MSARLAGAATATLFALCGCASTHAPSTLEPKKPDYPEMRAAPTPVLEPVKSGQAFVCQYEEPYENPRFSEAMRPVFDGEIGMLEIKRLAPERVTKTTADEGKRFEDPLGDLADIRLSVIAENVPMGRVAVALAKALGINVVVDPRAAQARVFMHATDTTVSQLVGTMQWQCDLRVSRKWLFSPENSGERAGLFFVGQARDAAVRFAREELDPLKIKLIVLPPEIPAVEFASAFCAMVHKERMNRTLVTVIGQMVIVRGTLQTCTVADNLAANLQQSLKRAAEAQPQVHENAATGTNASLK